MNILITGASGFIGSHLGNYLQSKTNRPLSIIGLDNDLHPCGQPTTFPTEYGDVRYYEDVDGLIENADLVYHLAAQINVDKSIEFPQETIDINIMGTLNVLNACRRYRVPMVFASTSEIYGSHTGSISEGSEPRSQSPYATSKLAADKLCGNYHDLYGLEIYRTRFFNVFGEWQNDDENGAVIPRFTTQAINGQDLTIYGDGSQSRDFIHVDDVVRAYEMIPRISELSGEPINIGTGDTHTIKSIAENIIKFAKSDVKQMHLESRKGEVQRLQADTSLIASHGFTPNIKFKDGLRRYVLWRK